MEYFWHKVGLWSKRLDQLPRTWSMFYSSEFPKCHVLWLAHHRNAEGGEKGLWRIDLVTTFLKAAAYADIKLKELIAFG